MKTKPAVKLILDLVMTGVYIALLFAYKTGLVFHEVVGMGILALFILHLVLNRRWIAGVAGRLVNRRLRGKPLAAGLLNLLIAVGAVVTGVTGILVSQVLFPAGGMNFSMIQAHRWASYSTGGLLLAHLLLHARYLAAGYKKMAASLVTPPVRRALAGSVAVLAATGVVYYHVIAGIQGSAETFLNAQPDFPAEEPPFDSAGEPEPPASLRPEKIDGQPENQEPGQPEKQEDEESSSAVIVPSLETAGETMTLGEFLGKSFCTACQRRCPLSAPQCGRSARQVEQVTAEYQELYGDGNG